MSETADADLIVDPSDALEPDAADPRAEIEAAAKNGGWTPKDQWTGKPEDYLDAPQFVLKAAEILPEVRKALKDARDEIKAVKKTMADFSDHHTKTETRMYEKARKDLEQALDQHTADNNLEGVKAVTKELSDMAVEAATRPKAPATEEDGSDPIVEAWIEKNPWFNSDPVMQASAKALSAIIDREGVKDISKNLAEVAKRIRAEFPHKFENQRRNDPAVVEGASPPRGGGKTFNDLPADAKAMCIDFEKSIKGFKRETYIRDWFA